MAPPGRQRSRRRPAAFMGLVESRKQQSCDIAARQVAVARLTRPTDRSFKNQRESLRATRNEAAALVPLSRRLEQDLLSLVCEKKRDDQASGRERFSSPVRSRQKGGNSRERRDSGDQQERRRRRKGSLPRRRIKSSSPSSSSSSDRSRRERRRRPRRRSRRSVSPEERAAPVRAPPSAAPAARASFRRNASQFTTPTAARTADVIRSGSGSPDRRQLKTDNDEKREQRILAQSLSQLHNALDSKRRQQFSGKSVLADVRRYCQDVAHQAQSEESLSGDVASPSSQQQEHTMSEAECVPDPDFVVDAPPVEDEVLVMELSSESQTASPASSLLPDSPREDEQPPFYEEGEEEEQHLDRRLERREEDVEEAATIGGAELWQRGGLPGTSASAFLVPWNRPAARQAGPHLAASPVPCVPSASCSLSDGFPKPGAGTTTDWRRAARLPPPVARPAQHSYSWRGELYPMPTTPAPSRPFMPPWSGPSPPLFSTPMFPSALREPIPLPRPPLPPPAIWERPAEEFITEFTPAEGRPARRCFSPTPDHATYFSRPNEQQRAYLPTPRPTYTMSRGDQAVRHYRMEGFWRLSGRRMF